MLRKTGFVHDLPARCPSRYEIPNQCTASLEVWAGPGEYGVYLEGCQLWLELGARRVNLPVTSTVPGVSEPTIVDL